MKEYMWYNIIFILIVFIVAFIGFTGYSIAKDNPPVNNRLSNTDLVDKLAELPDISANTSRSINAMCYDTAAIPHRTQYICPVCGERTLYTKYYDVNGIDVDQMPYYRNQIKKITKIDVKLDESQLCKKCSPNIESPQLCLIVREDKNSETHKTCGIKEEDINLLYEYSEGIKVHSTWSGNSPLSNYKARLEKLLGVKLKNNGK